MDVQEDWLEAGSEPRTRWQALSIPVALLVGAATGFSLHPAVRAADDQRPTATTTAVGHPGGARPAPAAAGPWVDRVVVVTPRCVVIRVPGSHASCVSTPDSAERWIRAHAPRAQHP